MNDDFHGGSKRRFEVLKLSSRNCYYFVWLFFLLKGRAMIKKVGIHLGLNGSCWPYWLEWTSMLVCAIVINICVDGGH